MASYYLALKVINTTSVISLSSVFKMRGHRSPILDEGVSKNLWSCLKTTLPLKTRESLVSFPFPSTGQQFFQDRTREVAMKANENLSKEACKLLFVAEKKKSQLSLPGTGQQSNIIEGLYKEVYKSVIFSLILPFGGPKLKTLTTHPKVKLTCLHTLCPFTELAISFRIRGIWKSRPIHLQKNSGYSSYYSATGSKVSACSQKLPGV